ncbi:MAG: hypothetical protein WCK98_07685 [bacterium]|jgi:ribosomal protein L35
MAGKIKFKAKTRKGATKRLSLSNPANKTESKIIIGRINHHHRLIGKTGERKLKAARKTTVSSVHEKYKKVI